MFFYEKTSQIETYTNWDWLSLEVTDTFEKEYTPYRSISEHFHYKFKYFYFHVVPLYTIKVL